MSRFDHPKIPILVLMIGASMLSSCNKNDFLNKKPSSALVVPASLDTYQAILDNDKVMQESPEFGELSTDDLYVTDFGYLTHLSTEEQNVYIWNPNIYKGTKDAADWDIPYVQAFYANIVLDGLPGITIDSSNAERWRNEQGSAYFMRAYAFYNVAQVFAYAYDSSSATKDLGIPLRLVSDISLRSVRANVQQTYTQILLDLKRASGLLPAIIDLSHLNRPSKTAALAMLARVYLSMRNYDSALVYADSCLNTDSSLINYMMVYRSAVNNISMPGYYQPFPAINPEILYQSHLLSTSNVFGGHFDSWTFVDPDLYASYADSDLRKYLFYTPAGNLRDSYTNTAFSFSGLAMDEVYLIKAECLARRGDAKDGIDELNALLINRWISTSFVAYNDSLPPDAALGAILMERRKELAFRGLRWADLRRLAAEGENITLTRSVNGTPYQLDLKDQRYVLLIPPNVISLSGIPQNP